MKCLLKPSPKCFRQNSSNVFGLGRLALDAQRARDSRSGTRTRSAAAGRRCWPGTGSACRRRGPDAARALHGRRQSSPSSSSTQLADLGVAQVQQVARCGRSGSPRCSSGDRVAARVAEALVDGVVAAQVVRGGHAGQAGAEDLDRCFRHAGRGTLQHGPRASTASAARVSARPTG